jgi:hypothetical protein
MRTGILATGLLATAFFLANPILSQQVLVFPGANFGDTYFTVHNIHPAHAITKGAGAKIGILDYSFGMDAHPELFAGGENFQVGESGESLGSECHHGYWMALVVQEIAPEAEVYALNTYSSDEGEKVQAMVKAIDWAVEHDLDAITYSAGAFSPEASAILDPAVDRATDAGVVVVFMHYPHERNLFPSGIGPRSEDDDREPDLNIFHYDDTVVFGDRDTAYLNGDDDGARGGYRPFLSLSSTAPVTAAFVALLRSLDPEITPAQVKAVLMASSHPFELEGRSGVRVPDVTAAVDWVQTRMARR